MHRTLTIVIVLLLVVMAYSCSSNQGSTTLPRTAEVKSSAPIVPTTPVHQVSVGGGNGKPVSVPGATPTAGGVPLQVHLYDDGSYDPDSDDIVTWEWNFADEQGGQGGWYDYTPTQGDAWHTYTVAGTYTAHLRVIDETGRKGVGHIHITLEDGLNANPVATANANPLSGNVPLEVSFSATGSYDPDGDIVKWEWDLDDGSGFQDFTTTSGATTHTYTMVDLYTAILRITDDDGAMATDSAVIEAQQVYGLNSGPWPTFGQNFQRTSTNASVMGPQTTPVVQWAATVGFYMSPVIDHSGNVYVASGSGWLTAVDGVSGDILWQYAASAAPTIAQNGTIYIGASSIVDGALHAINPDGTRQWRFPLGAITLTAPLIADSDGSIIVSTNTGYGNWYLVSVSDVGTLNWQVHTTDFVADLAWSPDQQQIYGLIGKPRMLVAFDTAGTQLWTYNTGAVNMNARTQVVSPDGLIFVADRKIYAIDAAGDLVWQVDPNGSAYQHYYYLTLGVDNTLYAATEGGFISAVDSTTGATKWTKDHAPLRVTGIPVADNNLLYIPSKYKVYAIDQTNGDLVWSIDAGDTANLMPIIGFDGALYTGQNTLLKIQ